MTRRWTERDINILEDLYKVRTMSKQQIEVKYFPNTTSYTYRRMQMLKEAGLIRSQVNRAFIDGAYRLAAHYRVTELGIRLLVQHGRVRGHESRSRDLKVTDKQRQYILDANELHVRVPGFPFLDSRAIKRKYDLNRGNLTVGGFVTPLGDYMIFVLQASVQERNVLKMIKEIQSTDKMKGYLIYYKSVFAKGTFEQLVERIGLTTGGIPVHLLPFDARGTDITHKFILGDNLLETLSPFGVLEPITSKYGFTYGMRKDKEIGKYVIELLTGDMLILKRCLTNYNISAFQREGRKVLLFCWDDEFDQVKERIERLNYLEVKLIKKPSII